MKGRLANLLLAAVVSAFTLGALEGGARLLERWRPRPEVAEYLWDWHQRWDGSDFYVADSDASGWPPWEEFNADGVRDGTHAVEKPDRVRRIVFLGDSVTFGDHIKREEAFPQQLQALADAERRPVEVFNVALLGWSTRQERIAYQKLARKYGPDDVVLAVCLNDIAELQNNLTRPSPWLARLHERSALVRAVVNARGREIASVEELFERRESPKVRQAMGRFFEEIRALRDEVEKDGGRLSVIVFPFRFQVVPGAPEPSVQREIEAFAASEGLPFRDLLPVLAPLGESAFVDYDHLSPAGARRVAEELAAGRPIALPEPAGALPETPKLLRWLTKGAELERALAARELGRRREKAALPALFDALHDPRAAVRWRAAQAIYEIGPPKELALPRYIEALGGDDAYVRSFAAWSLGALGPAAADAVPALVDALSREEAFSQGGAALALGKVGPAAREAVPALVGALESGTLARRRAAARALGQLGPAAAEAIPALVRQAAHPDEYLRGFVVRALARIDRERPEVLTVLRGAQNDASAEVRRQAKIALKPR
jgi:HEAT repeat protein/lysophospholipase L1-like esterase